jgi:type IV pilus assembly protein PilY1
MNLTRLKMGGALNRIAVFVGLSVILMLNASGAVPSVDIANGPLFSGRGNVHPNMVLSLSVEFPTVGIAYRGDDGKYNRTYEYVGYFNQKKCYRYEGGNRNITNGYFVIATNADETTHECDGDAFSGNFMNWAASSAIDMLRYALTGGDRIIDTPDATILQRAVLQENFYAHGTYFPRRTVTADGNSSKPGRVTPFDVTKLYVVSCRNRILFSDKKVDGECDSPAFSKTGKLLDTDKRLGEYLVRVMVCDSADAASRADLCKQYGQHYKPIGEMQRYAGQIRYAAMGYLMDGAAIRYGGVLRAPMKYVGAKKFEAPGFSETANDKLEWDQATGVFYSNPENPDDRDSTAVNSGVINYLNKFGRSGIYKELDPVGELYYEGIRYLQGKQPTPEATAGMTGAMKDGFPVGETWADPVIAACQRNYVVSIADVNTHWDRYIPGNDRTTYNNGTKANDAARAADTVVTAKTPGFDVKSWTALVGDMEADGAAKYANPAPRANLVNLQNIDTGSGGHGTHYMAGLAYWANTNDIRLDKPVRVKTFTIDVDEDGDGKIDANKRALQPRDSQLYLAAKYGGFDDRNGDGNPFITHGPDGAAVLKGSNTEWDSDGDGIPDNYFLAGQPKEMIRSIRKIFSNIANLSGTMSGVSVSATKISSDGAYVYQPGFNPSKWSGSLRKLKLTYDDAKDLIKIAAVHDWDAADILTGAKPEDAHPAAADRKIYTAKINDDKSLSNVAFKWDALADTQQALLNTSPLDGKQDGLGTERLNYLRGVRTLEQGQPGGFFRTRDRVLGDIVNSNMLYVGPPSLSAQGADYLQFHEANKNRVHAVYVGANDGMLHAFNAADGRELFAYVPNALFPMLAQLTLPEYVHRPYVDGAITVAEARVAGNWKTILASGMGGGAQGVFALDVTNPANFSGGLGALWEFTDSDDPDIGNLAGAPVIAKFKTKTANGALEYKYFVVVPSGLNNYKDDGDGKFNAAAPGALFLLSLDKSPSAKWTEGVNYFKFKLPIQDDTLQNGLASPALVIGTDGALRYAYAGDLQGRLWRFDFTGDAPWSKALGEPPHKPLFTAMDEKNNRQPITQQPKVVFAPGGGYVVLFGTGKFVEHADAAAGNFKTQSFYGILDTLGKDYAVAGRSELALRTLAATKVDGNAVLAITGSDFAYGATADSKKGWYFDFIKSDKSGERSVTNALVAFGRLFFNSLIPGTDPCAAGGGRSYALDTLTGLPIGGEATGYLSTVGLLSSPVLIETGPGELSDRDAIGRRSVKKKYAIANFGTGGADGTAAPAQNGAGKPILPAGRASWREVLNWLELRASANNK